jgi:hypothetical protein
VYIEGSWPIEGSTGWEMAVYNPGTFAETEHVQVYAICALIGG